MTLRTRLLLSLAVAALVLTPSVVRPDDDDGVERFIPSEEVSADLSVPFPVDI